MKKLVIIGSIAGLFVLLGVASQASENKKLYVEEPKQATTTSKLENVSDEAVPAATAPEPASPTPEPTPAVQPHDNQLSNDDYYTNSRGNAVHAPATTSDNSVPAGATAQCRDGNYSFSQSRSGTCSHHGGVETWL